MLRPSSSPTRSESWPPATRCSRRRSRAASSSSSRHGRRTRSARLAGPRQQQRRTGGRAVRQRRNDQDARFKLAGQAGTARSRASRGPGLRKRTPHSWEIERLYRLADAFAPKICAWLDRKRVLRPMTHAGRRHKLIAVLSTNLKSHEATASKAPPPPSRRAALHAGRKRRPDQSTGARAARTRQAVARGKRVTSTGTLGHRCCSTIAAPGRPRGDGRSTGVGPRLEIRRLPTRLRTPIIARGGDWGLRCSGPARVAAPGCAVCHSRCASARCTVAYVQLTRRGYVSGAIFIVAVLAVAVLPAAAGQLLRERVNFDLRETCGPGL